MALQNAPYPVQFRVRYPTSPGHARPRSMHQDQWAVPRWNGELLMIHQLVRATFVLVISAATLVGDRLRRRRSALPAATTARRGATAGSGPGGGRTARVATGHGNRGCWASSARLSGDHHGVPGCWVCLDSGRLDLGRRTLGMATGPLGASATPRHAMGAPALCLSWRPASLCPRWLEISAITAKPHHEYCTMQIVHGSHVDADKLCYRSAARRGWIHAGADRGRGAP
jgi:hypothetical protein